jgi:hypothetical protein
LFFLSAGLSYSHAAGRYWQRQLHERCRMTWIALSKDERESGRRHAVC